MARNRTTEAHTFDGWAGAWDSQPEQQQMQQTPPVPGPPPVTTPPPATFTQEDMTRVATREKAQGERKALQDLATKLGYDTPEAMETALAAQQEAARKAETDLQRREREVAEKEAAAAAKLAEGTATARRAAQTVALASLGAKGDNLTDAQALLALTVTDDADAAAIETAAKALQARRPELFAAAAAPSTNLHQQVPSRQVIPGDKPGDRGRREAERRGLVRPAAKD